MQHLESNLQAGNHAGIAWQTQGAYAYMVVVALVASKHLCILQLELTVRTSISALAQHCLFCTAH